MRRCNEAVGRWAPGGEYHEGEDQQPDNEETPCHTTLHGGQNPLPLPTQELLDNIAQVKTCLAKADTHYRYFCYFDQELFSAGFALLHHCLIHGKRDFATARQSMLELFGPRVLPHLRGWYEALRYTPGFCPYGMTPAAQLDAVPASPQQPLDLEKPILSSLYEEAIPLYLTATKYAEDKEQEISLALAEFEQLIGKMCGLESVENMKPYTQQFLKDFGEGRFKKPSTPSTVETRPLNPLDDMTLEQWQSLGPAEQNTYMETGQVRPYDGEWDPNLAGYPILEGDNSVWVPASQNISDAGKRVLMFQRSNSQSLNYSNLEVLLRSKLKRLLAMQAEDDPEMLETILEIMPDMSNARIEATGTWEPGDIATRMMSADSLGSLIARASDGPAELLTDEDSLIDYRDQDLRTSIENLAHETEGRG